MVPFLLPLLGAAAGAGLGALTNKNNRLKGALLGGGLGALGGSMGGPAIASLKGASAVPFMGPYSPATYAGMKGAKGLGAFMKKAQPFLKTLSDMGGGQQSQQELPPMSYMPSQPNQIASLSPSQQRPFAPFQTLQPPEARRTMDLRKPPSMFELQGYGQGNYYG